MTENMINIYNHSSANMSELQDGLVDLVLTSPPYNISTQYTDYNDSLDIESYSHAMSSIIGECSRVIKQDGLIAVNIPEFVKSDDKIYFHPKLYEDIFKNHGMYRRNIIFWVKTNEEGLIDPSNRWESSYKAVARNIHSVTEWIMVFCKMSYAQKENQHDGILYLKRNADKSSHPALWPLSLPMELINRYTSKGQVVLDPFMGIGTTGEACRNLSRIFFGYEISQDYYNVAKYNLFTNRT